jgi:glycerol-3-phosphate acyltransferase PlsY
MVVISYLVGSIPSAYIAGRRERIDVKTVGDHNAGAANVYRNIGHKAGALVAIVDIGKGAIIIILAQILAGQVATFLCGFAVVLGHMLPIFARFRGGRGQSTTIGVLTGLLPIPMIILLLLSAIPFFKTRNLVLVGVTHFVPLPLLAWLTGASLPLIVYSGALPCLLGLAHLFTTRHLSEEAMRESPYWR